jgi:hypothetical protein
MRSATLLLPLLCACAPTSPRPAPSEKPAAPAETAPAPDPAIAPRPFTAEQIRAAMPAGTEVRFRLEQLGKPPVVLHWQVTAADADTMTMTSRVLGEDGSVLSQEPAQASRWDELVEHATFPAARTVRSEGSVEVPAGRFATIDYVVTENSAGSVTVSKFRFARELPGPPIWLAVETDGIVVRRMVLLERTRK